MSHHTAQDFATIITKYTSLLREYMLKIMCDNSSFSVDTDWLAFSLQYGEIEEMNVCDNLGDHLVGNVYVKVMLA